MEQFLDLFNYTFFTNALLSLLLSSILCGIIGTYIVARRMVFISGGITHASFGGIGIAYFLGLNPFLGAMVFGVLSAIGIRSVSQSKKIREDTAIGVFWSLGMAVGIIFMFLTPGYAPNLMSFLFGNILTVTNNDLLILLITTLSIALFFIIFYKVILYIAFDEDFARAQKIPVEVLNYFMIILIALTIVLNIRAVGIILVLSLLTIPQTIANLFSNHFRNIIFLSIMFGFVGSIAGLVASYFLNIPSGATIIVCLALIYVICRIYKYIYSLLVKK